MTAVFLRLIEKSATGEKIDHQAYKQSGDTVCPKSKNKRFRGMGVRDQGPIR